jgi:hypothetical protein
MRFSNAQKAVRLILNPPFGNPVAHRPRDPFPCHSERREESSRIFETRQRYRRPAGFLAALLMNVSVCHCEGGKADRGNPALDCFLAPLLAMAGMTVIRVLHAVCAADCIRSRNDQPILNPA